MSSLAASLEEYRYAIEFVVAYDDPVTLETIRVSDGEFITKSTDTPANIAFEARISDPGKIGLHAYSDGRVGGGTKLETGAVRLRNEDGRFDDWIAADYSVDGREIVIRRGKPAWDYPDDWTTIFVGLLENFELTEAELTLNLRDPALVFDKPVCTAIYAGDNVLPLGVEGTEDDLKGRHKPMLYGTVTRVRVPCVNTAKLIYQVSHGPIDSHGGVEDRGLALPVMAGPDYPSLQSMYDNEPDPGYFRALLSPSAYFRLGATPDGEITWSGTYTAPDPAATLLLASVGLGFAVSATLSVDEDIVIAADVSTGSKLSFGVSAGLVLDGVASLTDEGDGVNLAFSVAANVTGGTEIGNAVDFDGSTYISRAGLTGAVDSKKITGIFYVRMDANDATRQYIVDFHDGIVTRPFRVRRETNNTWRVECGNTVFSSTATTVIADGWTEVIFSSDQTGGVSANNHIAIDDTADTVSTSSQGDATITVAASVSATVGGGTGGASLLNGCLKGVAVWLDTFYDLSNSSNRAAIRAYSIGTPIILQDVDGGPASDFLANQGSGGNFTTAAGALALCSTAP